MENRISIKPMEMDTEIKGKAYVHWKSWNEAYKDIISQSTFERGTLEHCLNSAYDDPANTYVAILEDSIVGFVSFGQCRDADVNQQGEIMAIYVLEKYYNAKVGYALIQKALSEMIAFDAIYVWVLEDNTRAIRFYERVGFIKEDITKILNIDGVKLNKVRMRLQRDN